jgi:ATP-binding cassette subfamily F protein uup
MVEWLENYLRKSKLALLMITHDRYFLDRVCNEILELDQQQLFSYKGNYSYYLEKRQERINNQNAELARANNLYRKELDWMRRQPQARAGKAQYRIDSFYQLEEKIKGKRKVENVQLEVKAGYLGSKIFEAKYISKSFGDLKILDNFYYNFGRYEKLGIVGNNGTGKSTFVKMLIGEELPDSGSFDIGETVRFGYYSQQGMKFNDQMKVIDAVREIAEEVQMGDGRKLNVSQFLQHFLFSPETQHNYIAKLSGGERRRLYLCTVLMKSPNFLVLDEPTNDLDIVTLNVLEEYLQSFKGCVIVISHDRYFMDKVVDHLFVFHGNANVQDFPGNYTDYRLWREMKEEQERLEKENAKKALPNPQEDRNVNRPKVKMSYKEKREFEELEKEIALLEEEKKELETLLCSGSLSADDMLKKSNRIGEIIEDLDRKELRWLELSELNG